MVGITGVPGTGKSSVARELEDRGHRVVRLVDEIGSYVCEEDIDRMTAVVDEERFAEEFPPVEGFVEGLLAHFLPCDRVVVLRCRPDVLRERLEKRGYPKAKIDENVEAEALDVILIETVERHPPEHILEIDTTMLSPADAADRIEGFLAGRVAPSCGTLDWSEYVMRR